VIATKSDHIQKAQDHADAVRAELDRKLTAATQSTTEAEGLKSRTEAAAESVAELLTDSKAATAATDAQLKAAAAARKAAEESAATAKQLADKSETVEKRIAEYETLLKELEDKSREQLSRIESLLPGATSAGLASAFDDRRKTFLKPHVHWQWLFVCSVLAIVALTATGLMPVVLKGSIPPWDDLLRMWLCRLPIVVALGWLAMHASRESALAKRLEEDYGYKAAISSCFEGFKKQMAEIGSGVEAESALAKLLENTLAIIASPPGRIYDKHELAVSPSDELKRVGDTAVAVANAAKPGLK
jgi:hypothetical protein